MNKQNKGRVWAEKITIPTYGTGPEDVCPHFFERRINQGASGRVYPYGFVDKILDRKEDREYEAVFLENPYLKIMVLPELGGRVQMAYDKVAGRHFVYHNEVIKPALIGFLGPWISGGIEFNWPMHHRPSHYAPLDWRIVENDDGSSSLWVGEQEKMFHTRMAVEYRLPPDKAYLKLSVRLYNGSDLPQSFLWWANIAVKSDNDHQHVFPPDVHSVYMHARSDSGHYPIMSGEYVGTDYGAGVDISRNQNIPAATSYMARPSKYSFCGAYSHQEKGGVLHIAEAGISPGKKLFTWGNSPFAQGWKRNLTDSSGPYLELMAGVFTDNQPDFAWIEPHEEKRFDECFLPYTQLGVVKNASTAGALQCEVTHDGITIGFYASAPISNGRIVLQVNGKEGFTQSLTLNAGEVWTKAVPVAADAPDDEVYACVLDDHDTLVLDYRSECLEVEPVPAPATPIPCPQDVHHIDELFVIGRHVEQYHHATLPPEDYYLQALQRDPSESRCNLAMGRLMLRRGRFDQAPDYLQQAWDRLTIRNDNPYDGEVSYLLGLCCEFLGHWEQAHKHYYKASWNGSWQAQAFLALGRLQSRRGRVAQAMDCLRASLAVNGLNHKAHHLLAVLARRQGGAATAQAIIAERLADDPLDYGLLYERYLLSKDDAHLNAFLRVTRQDEHTLLELAVDYARGGLQQEAFDVLALVATVSDPMVFYHQAYCCRERDPEGANALIGRAEALPPAARFPNRLEDIAVLEFAIAAGPAPKANFLLGNLYYDKRQYELAMTYWQESVRLDKNVAVVHRNLALGSFNKRHDPVAARKAMEQAVALESDNARFIFELNELYKHSGVGVQERFDFLAAHSAQVAQRDDLRLEWITLNNLLGRYQDALALMGEGNFHPWECGEGALGTQYVIALIMLGAQALAEQCYDAARRYFEQGMTLPENFGEQKLFSATDNDLKYFAALACEGAQETADAKTHLEQALVCDEKIHPAVSINTVSPPDYLFFRGWSSRRLGDEATARTCFYRLLNYGIDNWDCAAAIETLEIGSTTSYVFDEDLTLRHQTYCRYLKALGELGLGRPHQAEKHLDSLLEATPHHSRAALMQALLALPGGWFTVEG